MKNRVFVMLAPGFEEIDVSTVTRSLRHSGFSVALVGLAAGPVRGAYGLSLMPDWALSELERQCPRAVVLPGGVQAARRLNADPRLHTMIRRVIDDLGYVMAIDTAYTILNDVGLATSEAPLPSSSLELEIGRCQSAGWHGQVPRVGNAEAPPTAIRLLQGGQVVLSPDSGSTLEAALVLASLLERDQPTRTKGKP